MTSALHQVTVKYGVAHLHRRGSVILNGITRIGPPKTSRTQSVEQYGVRPRFSGSQGPSRYYHSEPLSPGTQPLAIS